MRTRRGIGFPTAPEVWTRRQLQALLALTGAVVVALIAGGVWSMTPMGHDTSPAASDSDGPRGRVTAQDRIAAAALPNATLTQAQPGPLSTATAPTMNLPAPNRLGQVEVPTGFPHTTAGAMAQLIGIDQTALVPASVHNAQLVIGSWAAAGGPSTHTWSGVAAAATLLSAAGLPADGSGGLAVSLTPAMGLVKGRVGTDFVVPCVDFVLTASLNSDTHRIAVADCQRMIWDRGRWVIGPGPEPAPAPSLWPGTQPSFDVGYQWLETSR